MKGAFFYVDAGKGHYIPAKALSESFELLGSDYHTELFDFHEVLGAIGTKKFAKKDWRFCLRHPAYERLQEGLVDNRFGGFLLKKTYSKKRYCEAFLRWYDEYKPDFIVTTHFQAGLVLPEICRKLGINIPVMHYEVDLFATPISGVPADVYRFYCAHEIGKQHAIKHGQKEDSITMVTYPMRYANAMYKPISKHKIREKLGIDDKFTLLLSFGGEGIGRIDLLEALAKKGHDDIQAVIIGGSSKELSAKLDRFEATYPDFRLYRRGFVDNVQEYVNCADLQVGNSGPNGMMESIRQRVPFIVTDLLHPGLNTKLFLKESPVGWFEKNCNRQVKLVAYLSK